MKKVIRLTESDLMRIVRRVISEGEKFGSFDNKEWRDKNDEFVSVDDMDDDYDEEEFPDFESLDSKHGHDTKWFGKGDRGRDAFNLYKDKTKNPFKVRTRRGMDEQSITGNNNGLYVSAGPARTAKVKKSPEGANNPEWINLVSKLKTLTYQPKILSFTSYGADHPSQSLNWGLAKSRNGKYTLAILTTDKNLPKAHMSLYNQKDRNEEKQMLNWWNNKGYKTDYNYVYFDFAQANKLKFDLESFFKAYPPE